MTIEQNELFNLAEKWVNETSRTIFLTGKAGTGKTTFLKHIKETTHKNAVVLAPTGIAAINAGGSTLHSFFRLPFGTFVPTYSTDLTDEKIITQQSLSSLIRYTRQHISLLRSIELVIIDEVSMVRADVMDMIDTILRRFRFAPHLPFGGVQMLFIGDMHQLPPVVKENEARILAEYYHSPYFFDSKVLKDDPPVIIQLEKIYRQQETDFLQLLNELRHNAVSQESYEMLLSKVTNTPPQDDRYITLTSHVVQADRINEQAMQKLQTPIRIFKAKVEGDFPENSYPAATELALKKGARVMFIKNDPERRFFNGKAGTLTAVTEESVQVRCDDEGIVTVTAIAWNHVKYGTNADTGLAEENVSGKFWQLPLRLAWAVTIHKSQGLTFDKVIIDAERSFAAGQVYVALSRCRTWDGIVLLSQIKPQSLLTDINVVNFSDKTWRHDQLEKTLPQQRHSFQTEKIEEAFDLSGWKRYKEQLEKTVSESERSFSQHAVQFFRQLLMSLTNLYTVADKFLRQVSSLTSLQTLPEENAALQKRLAEAAGYFSQHNQQFILDSLKALPEAPDSAQVSARALQHLETIRESAQLHQQIWQEMLLGFSARNILKIKAKALQEISKNKPLKWHRLSDHPALITSSENLALGQELRSWRLVTADALGVEVYRVLSNKAIDGIMANPPLNKKALLAISGIGNKKMKEFGDAILEIVARHFELKEEEIFDTPKKKKETAGGTHHDTLLLFRSGMNIRQVAEARNLAVSTVSGHFTKLIAEKQIALDELLSKERQIAIRYFVDHAENNERLVTYVKEQLGSGYEFHEIRWVIADMQLNPAKE
ncbi:MAG TPA: helix-turn-helix domain-containing protein [Flavipsychrobacter sp.]|nr:helix-turn-helix domain-containing protein [Flavipsychrobacter sp.]